MITLLCLTQARSARDKLIEECRKILSDFLPEEDAEEAHEVLEQASTGRRSFRHVKRCWEDGMRYWWRGNGMPPWKPFEELEQVLRWIARHEEIEWRAALKS